MDLPIKNSNIKVETNIDMFINNSGALMDLKKDIDKLKINIDKDEVIDKINNRRIVCVGFVHLLQELLFRMGIYDTIRWDVHSIEEEERSHTQGDNHARMLIHLVDPKYNIDGVYMSDPTWDERGLHDICIKHMLMAKEEIRRIDPEFSPSDLHLYRVNCLISQLTKTLL